MLSLAYLLAISLKELFPKVQIHRIEATTTCFFCDVTFPGEFTSNVMPLLEERMRTWVEQKASFKELTMLPKNAAELLKHHGDEELAYSIRSKQGEVDLLQLDRFFFEAKEKTPRTTGDFPFFKLIRFWSRQNGIRILGTGAHSKDALKEQAIRLRSIEDLQKNLEKLGFVSWVDGYLIWGSQSEALKEILKTTIIQLCQDFHLLYLPTLDEQTYKKLMTAWVKSQGQKGGQFLKKKLEAFPGDEWDPSIATVGEWWAPAKTLEDVNSCLQIITKFLTIFAFDYEVVSVGKVDADLEKILKEKELSWTSERGSFARIEFRVKDCLGRYWPVSSLQRDRKNELIQMTLLASFERYLALLIDKWEGRVPFRWQPFHVRLLASSRTKLEPIWSGLVKGGYRVEVDRSNDRWKERLDRSLHERVPFSIVIDDENSRLGQLAVYTEDRSRCEMMQLEMLLERLKQLENQ